MGRKWKEIYNSRLITAEQAAQMIKDGDRLCSGAREPVTILKALGKRTDLQDVLYYGMESNFMHVLDNLGAGIEITTSFLDDINRSFYFEGKMSYIPSDFSGFGKAMSKGLQCRIALPTVSKPNKDGYVSFGNSADCMPMVSRETELVIAEINENLPFVFGDNLMHISEIDYIVEGEGYPLNIRQIDNSEDMLEIYKSIGASLSELIEDGATVEVGIGRLNSSAMLFLDKVKDLGVHTEIYGDILMTLTEKGIINNSKKTFNPGISVCTMIVGTADLFEYVDNNPEIQMNTCQNVLSADIIVKNHKMTAINNAVEVDLLGQANAEYLKGKQFSGLGGIRDFASGAAQRADGKSIIVLESITKNGKFSKITPCFQPGTPVTLGRTMVEYVVTEYGIAKLVGRSVSERAKELINIAHPKFREELIFQAKKMGLIL